MAENNQHHIVNQELKTNQNPSQLVPDAEKAVEQEPQLPSRETVEEWRRVGGKIPFRYDRLQSLYNFRENHQRSAVIDQLIEELELQMAVDWDMTTRGLLPDRK